MKAMRVIKASGSPKICVLKHEVTDSVKKQADADLTKIKQYGLVDLGKRGKLVEIMRQAMRDRNLDSVDDQIRELVAPFLYNNGEGKMVPISRIVRFRNKDRPPSKRLPGAKETDHDDDVTAEDKPSFKTKVHAFMSFGATGKKGKVSSSEGSNPKSDNVQEGPCRECCWRVEERGAVGETVLHTCLLLATVVHLEIARRLVKLFPKLVNDIYVGDEYFGESPLHLAVVNEDPKMIRYLIGYGAKMHDRAIGSFFCADDQKAERFDTLDHEHFKLPLVTNYTGHVYWGEYPLSFAACLELEDCYRLLLAKEADPDMQDTNGNTVLHMCIIWNRKNIFDLAFELGADVSVKNRRNLTPIALAAELTRIEIFNYLIKLQRNVYWQFCGIATASYPLKYYDSIDVTTGEVDETAVLSVVAFGEDLGHLDMMDGVLVELLKSKWQSFARNIFFRQIKMFCVYFLITCIDFLLRPAPQIPPAGGATQAATTCPVTGPIATATVAPSVSSSPFMCFGNCSDDSAFKMVIDLTNTTYPVMVNGTQVAELDHCYLLKYDTTYDQIRWLFDLATIGGAAIYILSAHNDYRRLGSDMFLQTWSKVPGRVMFMLSCILIVSTVPLRLTCQPRAEDHIMVVAMFFTPMHFLYFCRGFKSVGPFVIMIYKMIVSDLLCFVLIYMIFVFGFAEAFFVIFRSHKGIGTNIYFSGFIDSLMTMFLMSLGEFGDVYGEFDNTDHPYLARLLFVIYMILVSVLLVNMLIAMMGHTYEDIASRPNEWLRQWARIVLIVERGLSKDQRLHFQTKYSEIQNGERVYLVQWETTEEEREQIQQLGELSRENIDNMKKRRLLNGKK